MNNTYNLIKNYTPINEQEISDKNYFLDSFKCGDVLSRNCLQAHFTASAFIINETKDKVLCIFHNIYKSWGWVGGHADGDDNMLYVAEKETKEETSLKNFSLLYPEPIAIDSLGVQSHYKNGHFVPSHTHLNVTYLFQASEKDFIHIQEDENSDIAWLTFDELLSKSSEPHMIYVYKKIIKRVLSL